jgi:hypothetical protein
VACRWTRYDSGMRDLAFVAVVVAFFMIATLCVRGCVAVVGADSEAERER